MNALKFVIGGLLIFLQLSAFAQSKSLQKANEHFKNSHFAEAAILYEEVLKEKKNLATKTKLAYCYRMNNRMDKAEPMYAEIVQNEKAKAETYYYYGEALMGNGKYDEAKIWFLKYDKIEPEEEKGKLMAENCDKVKHIQPYFQHIKIDEFSQNSEADDSNPVYWNDGIVFSSDRNPGVKLLKQKSGWTGRDFLNLFYSPRNPDSTFSEAKLFSIKINEVNKNTGNPSFLPDGSMIYFSRNNSELSKRDAYNMQLYSAENSGDNKWKNITKLSFCSSEYNYMHPAISPDGKQLFFVSDKGKGKGGTDIWVSKRNKNGWGRPQNLSATINTATHEGFPFMDETGNLYFCSKGHPSYGGFDIFVTKPTANGDWEIPVNLGRPINSPFDDISISIKANQQKGLFTSARNGGDDDIFLFEISDKPFPEKKPVILATQKVETPIVPKKEIEKKDSQIVEETPKTEKVKTPKKKKTNKPKPQKEEKKKKEQVVELIKEEVIDNTSSELFLFSEMLDKIEKNDLAVGSRFRLEGAIFDDGIFQITPNVAQPLNELAKLLRFYSNIEIEIGAHTGSLGVGDENLRLSQNRAVSAMTYLLKLGISPNRIIARGFGETRLLNDCGNGVECSDEKHLENQRLEIKILKY